MKKIFLILLLAGTTCFAQNTDSENYENSTEVKFNALSISLGALELEVEQTLSKRSSIGLSGFINFRDADDYRGFNNQTSVAAFYRYYLGKQYAQGFFFEGFGMYNTSDVLKLTIVEGNGQQTNSYETFRDFGMGIGLGYKWVSKKGLILQGNFGLGRNFFNADFGEKYIGRLGVSVGYRF